MKRLNPLAGASLTVLFLAMPLFAQTDVQRSVSADGRTIVETLRGKAAAAHLDRLEARNKKHFARASSRLLERGYKPTDIIIVQKTLDVTARRDGVHPAQSTASDATGEVTFWSWDDGFSSTWEGQVYMEDYTTGAAALLEGQIDLNDPSWTPLWEEEIYYSGGGTPRGGELMTRSARPEPVQVASIGQLALATALRDDIQLVQGLARLRAFFGCATSGCAAAMSRCHDGPSMPACIIGSCVAVLIDCAQTHGLM